MWMQWYLQFERLIITRVGNDEQRPLVKFPGNSVFPFYLILALLCENPQYQCRGPLRITKIHSHSYLAILLWVLARLIRQASAAVQIIDDRDPNIQYTNGIWEGHGIDAEYRGTTSLLRTRGGTAILSFTGTQVAVYGTLGPVGNYTTQSTYTIGQGPPRSFIAPYEINQVQYQIRFYMSEQLPISDYTLTIVNQGDWLFLDYIEVTVPDLIPPTTSPNRPSSSSQISSSLEITMSPLTSLLGPSSLSNPQTAEFLPSAITTSSGPESVRSFMVPSSSSLSTADPPGSSISTMSSVRAQGLGNGVIVGIVFGSLMILLGLLVLLYIWLKRRRVDAEADPSTTLTTPFLHAQRRAFSPASPARIRTSALSESSHALGSTTVLDSVDPTASMSRRYSPPPSDVFSTVPQLQHSRGPEKILVNHSNKGLVAPEKPHDGPTTFQIRNASGAASIDTDTLPPAYRRF